MKTTIHNFYWGIGIGFKTVKTRSTILQVYILLPFIIVELNFEK